MCMIEILKEVRGSLKTLSKPTKGCWINVEDPTDRELEKLQSLVKIPDEVLISLRDEDEVPTIEKFPGLLFVLIRTPKKEPDPKELTYRTSPLGIIITKNYFVTISFTKSLAITKLKAQTLEFKGIQPLLHITLFSAKSYLKHLKEINKEMYATQENLEKSTKNEEIMQLLELEKSLVFFSTAISSNRLVVERLAKYKDVAKRGNQDLIEDVLEEYKQAANMTKVYSIVLANMMEAFGTIVSNNLNTVIKTLTSITIILMIPTLITSAYGMNLDLPFQNHPQAFWIITCISALLSVIGIAFFWRKELF